MMKVTNRETGKSYHVSEEKAEIMKKSKHFTKYIFEKETRSNDLPELNESQELEVKTDEANEETPINIVVEECSQKEEQPNEKSTSELIPDGEKKEEKQKIARTRKNSGTKNS